MPYGTRAMLLQEGTRRRWRPVRTLFALLIGAIEPHSHVRWLAVRGALSLIPGVRKRVLEVSCGGGEMTLELVSYLRPRSMVTFDIASPPRFLPQFALCFRGDATRLPLQSKSMNLVAMVDVIEHIEQDDEALAEAYRVLCPGGYAVISVPTPNYPRYFGRTLHESLGHVRDGYTREALLAKVTAAGLEPVFTRGYTGLAFLLFARLYYTFLRYNVFLAAAAVTLSRPVAVLDRSLPSPRWGSLILIAKRGNLARVNQ